MRIIKKKLLYIIFGLAAAMTGALTAVVASKITGDRTDISCNSTFRLHYLDIETFLSVSYVIRKGNGSITLSGYSDQPGKARLHLSLKRDFDYDFTKGNLVAKNITGSQFKYDDIRKEYLAHYFAILMLNKNNAVPLINITAVNDKSWIFSGNITPILFCSKS